MSSTERLSEPHQTVSNRGAVTVSIMLATVMQVLDTTIANIALPHMQASLNAAQDTITWVLTSYIVAAAIMTPVTGWLSDRMTRKRLFLVSVGGFTLTSVLCGLATSLPEMVFFRLLQGVCGAALVPLSQAVLLDINPRERHGQAMAMWGAGIMVGPIIGPTLGGWLTETLDWRWVFFVNLPVGVFAFLGILVFLPGDAVRKRGFDFFGFAMLSLGIGALQMLLDRGEQQDWFSSTEIWIEAGLIVCGLWAFIVHSFTARDPFIHLGIFRDRNFSMGLIFIFIIGIVLLSSLALLPPMLQNLMGYPVITTGFVLAPRGVGTMISMIVVGRLLRFVDARIMVFCGLVLTAWSLYMMTGFSIEMTDMPVIVSGVIQGLGLGLVFVPLSTLTFATLQPSLRTDAASLFSLMRNVGSSIGISVVSTLLAQYGQINHAEIAERITPFSREVGQILPGLLTGDPTSLYIMNNLATQQALMIGYLNDFLLMMYVTIAAIPIIFLLRRPKQAAAPVAEAPAME